MKYAYLPEAEKSFDFIILGSKPGFAAMLIAAVLLAIIGGMVIINVIRKNKK